MSQANKLKLIKAAREAGMSNQDILREILRGVYGGEKRRRLVVEWGELLGLTANGALQIAHVAGLIPSAHPPRGED